MDMTKLQTIKKAKEEREIQRLKNLTDKDFNAEKEAAIVKIENEIDVFREEIFGFNTENQTGAAVESNLDALIISEDLKKKINQYGKPKTKDITSHGDKKWTISSVQDDTEFYIEKDNPTHRLIVYVRPTSEEKAKRKANIRKIYE